MHPVVPALAVSLLWASAAFGQACCSATGDGGLGVVGRCHKGIAAVRLEMTEQTGAYDPDGGYLQTRGAARDVVLSTGLGWRLTRRFQVHGSVPIRWQQRDLSGLESQTAQNLGDTTLGARLLVAEDDMAGIGNSESPWPFIDLDLAVRLPTGIAPEDSTLPSAADVTGTGHTALRLSTQFTRFVTPWHAVVLRAGVEHSLSRDVEGLNGRRKIEPGQALSAAVGWFYRYSMRWNGTLITSFSHTTQRSEDNKTIPDSQVRRLKTTLQIQRALVLPYWDLTASVSVEPWWAGADRNVPSVGPSAALMLQRNFL